ncbi:SDR family NAD(P)-dependent oxidoreductase [Cryptosporangium sp. NPDC048952]|uniref:SDR family NAD(P)-dependent oxidoreductase n=1 Tax=Cryptosporangium sp. NPDC048952 TaxID=3363961 RepID=UPI003724BB15
MNKLTSKAALVTGGLRGIGAAIARRLSECGADVGMTYVQGRDQADAVACGIRDAGRRAIAIKADGRNVDEVTAAVDQTAEMFGRLNIVCQRGAGAGWGAGSHRRKYRSGCGGPGRAEARGAGCAPGLVLPKIQLQGL